MEIEIRRYSDERSNTYVIYHDRQAIVFDPSSNDLRLVDWLKQKELKVAAIMLTHGHFDHFGGVMRLQEVFQCPVYISEYDVELLEDPRKNGSAWMAEPEVLEEPITPLTGDEVLTIAGITIQVIATPFHTAGSLGYYLPSFPCLISGDTLFKGSIGRSDLYGGQKRLMRTSLQKLRELYEQKGDMRVLPGHGEMTSLSYEITHNPYFHE